MITIDTSVLIELEAGNLDVYEKLKEIRKNHTENPALPFPCFSEFYYGILRSKGNIEASLEFLNKFTPLHSTQNSAKLFAEIKIDLEKKGKLIKTFDMIIAALSIDHGTTLVTLDRDFENIKDLNFILL